jgi:hypothetical protein
MPKHGEVSTFRTLLSFQRPRPGRDLLTKKASRAEDPPEVDTLLYQASIEGLSSCLAVDSYVRSRSRQPSNGSKGRRGVKKRET